MRFPFLMPKDGAFAPFRTMKLKKLNLGIKYCDAVTIYKV